ncbi:MAG TPA: flagellar filament capping protein FliD [Terriglobales bacterium]|nr:flagellar filament capping protein FliD [Terriglobales bacterium]
MATLGLPALNTQGLLANSTTGLNVAQLVNASMAALEIPQQNLQNEQALLSSQSSALSALNSDLNAFQTAFQTLTSLSGALDATAAASSNTGVLTASSDSTAAVASHTVLVNSLAVTSSYDTNELASSSTTFGTGSFTIQVGSGTAQTVTVDSTNNTLSGLATAINSMGLGATASVVTDANGARLSIVSNTSGAAGDLTIANVGGLTGLSFTKTQTGANASLTVDGTPISSASNTVTGAISGVTLNLVGASTTPVTVSVSPDTSSATTAIKSFVSAYNTLIGDINKQFATTSTTSSDGTTTSVTAGVLMADPALSNVQEQLLSAMTYSMSGNNGITSLSSLGITMNQDGTLTVNSSTLQNALSSNFSAVQTFFQGASGTFGSNLTTNLTQLTDPVNGPFNLELTNISTQQNDLSQQLTQMQGQLAIEQQQLLQEYSQANAALQTLPLMLQQISSQLGSLSSFSSPSPTHG